MFLDITLGFDSLWQSILYVLCGLGIFLFGINLMGSSLKEVGGSRMKVIIQKSTSTPLKGMLVGFVVTMLTQSASGTSAFSSIISCSRFDEFHSSIWYFTWCKYWWYYPYYYHGRVCTI